MTSPATPEQLLAYDRDHVWHPYTSMTEPTPVRLVTSAQGSRLGLADGREVIDGMSSWWAAIHGYRHPALDAALKGQADDFAHVMFGGLTHAPAIRLAQRLVEITPTGLEHVFLADSGSVSVEVALKMAIQYQRGAGRPERTRMLTVRGGYHGDTCGCMGVCDPENGMHTMFRGFVADHVFGDQPPSDEDGVDAWASSFRKLAEANAHELAGIVVEPLLQGAGGMYVYPAACLRVMREVSDEHGLVLILDEIATGFGRTGTLFAADAAGVVPDIMCVGKALTGGYLSLAAAICTSEVAQGLSASESGVLMHGPTYMGNPLACSVALANLDLLATGDWRSDVERIHRRLATGLAACSDLPDVADVRTIGAVGVVELARPVQIDAATEAALEAGVWLRPFRNLIYTMPPYICTDDEIDRICGAITRAAVAR
jgi:adenosylmethionine---8-amino-7-oxononanoate aminotransferase